MVHTVGGIQTVLARHARADAGLGFKAHQVSLFDRTPARPGEPATSLGFSGMSPPREMRRALAKVSAQHAGSAVVYHGAWGVPWFADVDSSRRRILYLHDSIVRYAPELASWEGLVDGVMCNSESTARAMVHLLPGLTPERVAVPPLPIEPPADMGLHRPEGGEWVVGCAGRVERAHKRLDRLVPFMAEVHRLGLKCRLEVMGRGPLGPWLERRLGSDPAVRFLGYQDDASYWRRLQTWDAVVCFSDHEGGPITLLQAMAAGVIPIYPAIGGSVGDDYTPRVDPRGYYTRPVIPSRRRAQCGRAGLAARSGADRRRRARALVQPHATTDYEKVLPPWSTG